MSQFINALVSGIALGGIYAIIALGFVIIYRATHTLNFAQGTVLTFGAYVFYWLKGPVRGVTFANPPSFLRMSFYLALPLALLIAGLFGWILELVVIRRFRGRPVFAVIMATLGVGAVLSAFDSSIWGTSAISFKTPFGDRFVKMLGTGIKQIDIFTLCVIGVITLAFFFGFQRSKLGTAMKATAFDQEAAIAQGISPKVIFGASWAISAALAGWRASCSRRGPAASPRRSRPASSCSRWSGSPPSCSAGSTRPRARWSAA
jgi:branched-chain amino acid transport system permease protein